MKKLLLASILATTTFATTAVANEGVLLPNLPMVDPDLSSAFDLPSMDPLPQFGRQSGIVLALNELPDGALGVLIGESAEDLLNAKQFNIHADTLVLGELEVGTQVTGFFSNVGPMTMSIPAQVAAVALVTADAALSVTADHFVQYEDTDSLINDAHTLRINIDSNTLIQDVAGNAVDWDLTGRNLVVVYGVSTRSIPALATPSLVVVLPVTGMMPMLPSTHGMDMGDDQTSLLGTMPTVDIHELTDYPIIVEGTGISFDFMEHQDTIYVPIRAIVDSIGGQLAWEPAYPRVQVIWNDHAFLIYVGTNTFARDGETLTLGHESLLLDGTTFVPLAFFREVMGFNNAYFHGGHVQINNLEAMQ